jgi:hypothetical protein
MPDPKDPALAITRPNRRTLSRQVLLKIAPTLDQAPLFVVRCGVVASVRMRIAELMEAPIMLVVTVVSAR